MEDKYGSPGTPEQARRRQLIGIGVIERRHPYPEAVVKYKLIHDLMSPREAFANLSIKQHRPYEFVDTFNELEFMRRHLQLQKVCAIDIEKTNGIQYTNGVSLLQVSTAEVNFIVDVMKVGHLIEQSLKEPLENSLLIGYNSVNDIVDLKEEFNIHPVGFLDLGRYAQHKLGLSNPPAFTAGIGHILGEDYDKEHEKLKKSCQRSDWFLRPLSSDQLSYAAGDTKFLLRAFFTLCYEKVDPVVLQAEGVDAMKEWVGATVWVRDTKVKFEDELDQLNKQKGQGFKNLNDEKQVLLALWDYRKVLGILYDVNVSRLFTFQQLFQLARKTPSNVAEMENWLRRNCQAGEKILDKLLRRHSHILFRICRDGKAELLNQLSKRCWRCLNYGHISQMCYLKSNNQLASRTKSLMWPATHSLRQKISFDRWRSKHPSRKNIRRPRGPRKVYEWPSGPKSTNGLPTAYEFVFKSKEGQVQQPLPPEQTTNQKPKCPWTGGRPRIP